MDRNYRVAIVGADHLTPAQRIALETRFAQELEGFLGSSQAVEEHLVASAIAVDSEVDDERTPGSTRFMAKRLERAIAAAESAVWASAGNVPGASFRLHG